MKSVPSLEVVAAAVKRTLPVPQIFFVVLGQQGVEERVDATVAVGQAGGQVVDVPSGFRRHGKRLVVLEEQLPDPEWQEAGPEDQDNGED